MLAALPGLAQTLLEGVAWLAVAWASLLAWLAIGAVLRRRALARRLASLPTPSTSEPLRVLLMRPCAGQDPGLLDNLLSVTRLRSTASLKVVMAVDDQQDRAYPILLVALEQLRAAGVDAAVELVPNRGPNRKASILAGVLERHASGHAVIVNVDSNVDLAGFELDRLLAPLREPTRAGAAWAPWAERSRSDSASAGPWLGARASEAVLGGALTAFPLLCGLDPEGLVGKLWAIRGDALAQIGGFDELVYFLGEDFELARRLRAAAWQVTPADVLACSQGGRPRLREVIERFARWMLVVRGQRPALLITYPVLFFATPLVLGLLALGALARPDLAVIALVLVIAARGIIGLAAAYWSRRSLAPIALLTDAALADLVLALAWIRALQSRDVAWRGHRLRVERGGRLRALD